LLLLLTLGAPFISNGVGANPSFGSFINLPTSASASVGTIQINGSPVFHTFGTNNVEVGKQAGNFTLSEQIMFLLVIKLVSCYDSSS